MPVLDERYEGSTQRTAHLLLAESQSLPALSDRGAKGPGEHGPIPSRT